MLRSRVQVSPAIRCYAEAVDEKPEGQRQKSWIAPAIGLALLLLVAAIAWLVVHTQGA